MNPYTLIWLFPVVFMLHDFEEVILFEPWLKQNGETIQTRFASKLPLVLQNRLRTIFYQSTAEFSVAVCLIFVLSIICTLFATVYHQPVPFYLAASLFFLHGFMHIGQSIFIKKYVPALITSLLIVLPYGTILFSRLLILKWITWQQMLLYFVLAAVFTLPFIFCMLMAGEFLYKQLLKALINKN